MKDEITMEDLWDRIHGSVVGGKRTELALGRFGGRVTEEELGYHDGTEGARFRFRTVENEYSIIAIPPQGGRQRGYMGGVAGVIGGGGRDLFDGPFTLGTWLGIMEDVVAFELGSGLRKGDRSGDGDTNSGIRDGLADGPWNRMPRGAFGMLTVGDADGKPVAHVTESSKEHLHANAISLVPRMVEVLELVEAAHDIKFPEGEVEPYGWLLRGVLAELRAEKRVSPSSGPGLQGS